jgi:hypothetical protein
VRARRSRADAGVCVRYAGNIQCATAKINASGPPRGGPHSLARRPEKGAATVETWDQNLRNFSCFAPQTGQTSGVLPSMVYPQVSHTQMSSAPMSCFASAFFFAFL